MSAATGPSSAWRVFRMRNFGPYFVGNALSASGGWFQNLASAIFVYQETHSALLLGVLNAFQFGPVLLLSPWTGQIADAFDRRRLLIWTQAIAACVTVTLAVLVWHGEATTWLVIGFAGVVGVVTAVSNPAQMALVGSLVPRDSLAQAVALNSMTFNLARAIGPAAAALVIAAFGIAPAFAINAVLVPGARRRAARDHADARAPRAGHLVPRQHRHPAGEAAARRVPRHRDGGRDHLRPDQHRIPRDRPRVRLPAGVGGRRRRLLRARRGARGDSHLGPDRRAPTVTSPAACFSSGAAWC